MKKFTRKQRLTLEAITLCLIVGLIGLSFWQNTTKPQNIGPSLEYIGQKNFGCSWLEGVWTLGFCGDRESNHSYFYETDLSDSELELYFKNICNIELQKIYDSEPPYPYISTEFRVNKDDEYATAMYYPDAHAYLNKHDLNAKTAKAHLFEVNRTTYPLIRACY